jgi:hypothetical protein
VYRIELAVGDFVKLSSSDDHGLKKMSILPATSTGFCRGGCQLPLQGPANGGRTSKIYFEIPNLKSEKFSFTFGAMGNIIVPERLLPSK